MNFRERLAVVFVIGVGAAKPPTGTARRDSAEWSEAQRSAVNLRCRRKCGFAALLMGNLGVGAGGGVLDFRAVHIEKAAQDTHIVF